MRRAASLVALALVAVGVWALLTRPGPTCDGTPVARRTVPVEPADGVRLEPLLRGPPPAAPPGPRPETPDTRKGTPVFRVRVVDAEERPVDHVTIDLRSTRDGAAAPGSGSYGVDGELGVPVEQLGDRVDVEAHGAFDADGRSLNLLPARVTGADPRAGPLVVRMEAGRRIDGRVVDEAGAGVPRVDVWIEERDSHLLFHAGSTMSDADGTFEFVALPRGRFVVIARPKDTWLLPDPVPVAVGEEAVTIRLVRGDVVEGRVVGPDGTALGKARVRAVAADRTGETSRSARAGDDGRFAITGVPPGEPVTLEVDPGIGQDERTFLPAFVDGVRGGTRGLVVRLERGGRIEGEVVGPDGEPVQGARVRLRWDRFRYRESLALPSAESTESGRFVLQPVPPGTLRVYAAVPGETLAPSGSRTVRAGDASVRLALGRPASLEVRLVGDLPPSFGAWWWCDGTSTGWESTTERAITIEGLRDEEGTLLVRSHVDGRVALLEGITPSRGPFEVRLAEGLTVSGRLTRSGAAPEHGYWVNLWRDAVPVGAPVREDGSFEVQGVPPGEYELELVKMPEGRRLRSVPSVAAGARGLVLLYDGD